MKCTEELKKTFLVMFLIVDIYYVTSVHGELMINWEGSYEVIWGKGNLRILSKEDGR